MKKILNTGLLIGFTGLAVLFFFLDPAKHTIFPRCVFNSLTGYYCPGCGSQRAIHSMLHLDFAGVVRKGDAVPVQGFGQFHVRLHILTPP